MCGIAGIVQLNGDPVDTQLLEAMTRSLAHRGPDGYGYVLLSRDGRRPPFAVTSESCRRAENGYDVGFGHRRLAVLDRSSLGSQPMSSRDGRMWITYNGEIYNYVEIRRELTALGRRFRSMTDTEVVLQAYEEWGATCVTRFNGMFAFAIWDAHRRRLFCARDRLGMKPFYYRISADRLTFASEMKALLEDPSIRPSPHHPIIYDFLVLSLQDHTDETFFEGIKQLRPGHALVWEDAQVRIDEWWNIGRRARQWRPDEYTAETFADLFRKAVDIHLRSDVPIGSCLSGGLDSSSIVCTMRRQLPTHRLQTFSVYFEDPHCDERRYIREVVLHAGTDSVELQPDAKRLYAEMPDILRAQEEPFAGTSYLAQWDLMRTASESGVRVLLDGQGGDELLCGYPGYWGSYIGDLCKRGAWGTAYVEARAYYRRHSRIHPTVFSNFARAIFPSRVIAGVRFAMKRHALWLHPDFSSAYKTRDSTGLVYDDAYVGALERHTASYLHTHSLPALLHHEDRSSMAFSVEARLPFLDAQLTDFLLGAPPDKKLFQGQNKVMLRDALQDALPAAVSGRTDKLGFATPQDRWLRQTLRPELDALFHSPEFERRGYWDGKRLRDAYHGYCRGDLDIGGSVWRWACLELWHRRFFR